MGFFSNGVKKHEIREGDHIYVYRAAFTYSHHGIFVGENKVVHFTPKMTQSSSTQASLFTFSDMSNISASCPTSGISNISSSCPISDVSNISVIYPTSYPDCGFRQPNSGVVISCLDCFLQNGSPRHFEYGVGSPFFLTRVRGGTCTTAKSDPPQLVIYRAMHLLQKGFGNYYVFENNCEDFALYCKTGLLAVNGNGGGSSGKAYSLVGVPLSALVSSSVKYLISTGPVGMATITAGTYLISRYSSDIGVRTDVTKVAVDDVAVILGAFYSNEALEKNKASN